jgi:hypothetical protein
VIVGDRIKVFGGYDATSKWLWGRDYVVGSIVGWIPREERTAACVVKLEDPLPFTDGESLVDVRTGEYLVLRLRYRGATWEEKGTVLVEVFQNPVESLDWDDQDHWVESHATYEVLD